ncbi:hypothetical protein [Photobacterium iliopiscarium]|nr:hypothetical protein [Photobacterium iliopiscarium]MCD9468842.1 hypothetical protein [Photobacterium iliopiscarium]
MPIEYLKGKIPAEYRDGSVTFKMYEVISNMSEPQRFHFHMKKGFKDGSCSRSPLYKDMDEDDKELIKDGFGATYAGDYTGNSSVIDCISTHLLAENNHEVLLLSRKFMNYIRLPV